MQEVLMDVNHPKDDFSSRIFILTNEKINQLYSVFKHLEKLKSDYGKGSSYDFCYFELERFSLSIKMSSFVTIESLFSNFIFVKFQKSNGETENQIYYFGTYEKSAIAMFASALYRYQIHLVDNLSFYPVSLKSPMTEMHGLTEYVNSNQELVFGEQKIKIKLKNIDEIQYKLMPSVISE